MASVCCKSLEKLCTRAAEIAIWTLGRRLALAEARFAPKIADRDEGLKTGSPRNRCVSGLL